MWTREEALDFADVSAWTAWDQKDSREFTPDFTSKDSAFDNLRDTLQEYGVTDQYVIADAEAAYHAKCAELFGADAVVAAEG